MVYSCRRRYAEIVRIAIYMWGLQTKTGRFVVSRLEFFYGCFGFALCGSRACHNGAVPRVWNDIDALAFKEVVGNAQNVI